MTKIDFATCKMEGKVFDKLRMKFIDSDGRPSIKLLAKKNTFVGTAEYVSPEVLVDKEVGHECDLWALGCIIYQMFTGIAPFKDKTEYLIFKKILELDISYPEVRKLLSI
jgi:3-phosphoinositide dependent protein kinase-1